MIEVVCAVILKGERVLLCQRPEGKHLAGSWEFPGGKIEDGESSVDALVREIFEELGCEIEVGDGLDSVEHVYPEFLIRLRPFVCRLRSKEPQALEHAALRWVGVDDASKEELAGADLEVARQISCRNLG